MKTVHIRKTICTLLACIMMAYCLPSCTGTAPVSTTVSGTTQQTGSEAPKELPNVDEQIKKLVALDLKDQAWFDERGIRDQHGGGGSFAHEADIMSWLFGEH